MAQAPESVASGLYTMSSAVPGSTSVHEFEETVAEKLRAILQRADMLAKRGSSRAHARDYDDVWRVIGAYQGRLDLIDFASLLREKCALRGIEYEGPDTFFQARMLSEVEQTWESVARPARSRASCLRDRDRWTPASRGPRFGQGAVTRSCPERPREAWSLTVNMNLGDDVRATAAGQLEAGTTAR